MSDSSRHKTTSKTETENNPANESEESCSVTDLIDMARGLSEGDFNVRFEHQFQGDLGQLATHLISLRQNLQALDPSISSSTHVMSQSVKDVDEISQRAELGVNAILELVEGMTDDYEEMLDLLEKGNKNGGMDVARAKEIVLKGKKNLSSVMSFLSFQDVVRQRSERIRDMLQEFEQKIMALLVKFRIKVKTQEIKEGDGREILREDMKDLSEGMGFDQSMVDDLLDSL